MTTLSASHSTRLQTMSVCNWPSVCPSTGAICTRLLYRVGGLDSQPCGQSLDKWFVDWQRQHRLTNRFWSALWVGGLDSLSCRQSLAKWSVVWHRQQRLATRFGSTTGVGLTPLPDLAAVSLPAGRSVSPPPYSWNDLEGGYLYPPRLGELNWPRSLAVAPMWQLIYVSDNLATWSGWKQTSPSSDRT